MSTDNISEVCYNDIKKMENDEKTESATPDSEGDAAIVNPDKYEKGYDSSKSKNVKKYNLTYKLMSSFSAGGVCAPTAATNLLYYWYNRGDKYNKLCYKSWKNTFEYLYDYMETTKKDGTKDSMVATGYSKYLNKRGYSYSVNYHSGTDYGKDIMKEIDKDRPCHLIVHNHYYYGEHSVVALGYQQYVYEHWYGDNHETYIRIADGWTNNASRFVWGSCKGNWNYVSVHIK